MNTWKCSIDILINELYRKNSPDAQIVYDALTTLSKIVNIDITKFSTPGENIQNINLDLHDYMCTCYSCEPKINGRNQYD